MKGIKGPNRGRAKKIFILNCIFLNCISLTMGCATTSKQLKEINIRSTPQGANISYYYENQDKKTLQGVTPFQASIKQKRDKNIWVIAELPGYETEILKLEPTGTNPFNQDLALEKDFSIQLKAEREGYSREYIQNITGLLKTCEKILSSHGMLAVSIISMATTEYQDGCAEFPEYKRSTLDRAIQKLLEKMNHVTNLQQSNNHSKHVLLNDINTLITKIYFGLRSF